MVKLYRIVFGFLKVRFYGEFKERILSLCALNGITLWNTRNTENGIECYISVPDFKYIRKLHPKGVRVHIIKKTGLPFITKRYKKRSGILVGAILFFAILKLMSSYIWIIDVAGNYTVSDKEVISACESIGIREGIKKNSIYPKIEREKLLLKLDKVAWASLNIEGSRLTVNISERKETYENKVYSNLKATTDGIITKMDIVSGTSVVKVGQAVKKGDLLVSGIVETADLTRFVNSKGTVLAETKLQIKIEEKYSQKIKIPTGKVKQKYVLEVFKLKFPLYLSRENKNYISAKKSETVKLFGQNLPVKIHKKRFEFYNIKQVNFNSNDLNRKLEKRFLDNLKDLKCEKYEIINKKIVQNDDGSILIAEVKLIENIVYEDKILINTGN